LGIDGKSVSSNFQSISSLGIKSFLTFQQIWLFLVDFAMFGSFWMVLARFVLWYNPFKINIDPKCAKYFPRKSLLPLWS